MCQFSGEWVRLFRVKIDFVRDTTKYGCTSLIESVSQTLQYLEKVKRKLVFLIEIDFIVDLVTVMLIGRLIGKIVTRY